MLSDVLSDFESDILHYYDWENYDGIRPEIDSLLQSVITMRMKLDNGGFGPLEDNPLYQKASAGDIKGYLKAKKALFERLDKQQEAE